MPKFIVASGTFKVSKDKTLKVGDTVEISSEERDHVDPKHTKLLTPEKFQALKAKEAAEKKLAEPEKPEQTKSNEPQKGKE